MPFIFQAPTQTPAQTPSTQNPAHLPQNPTVIPPGTTQIPDWLLPRIEVPPSGFERSGDIRPYVELRDWWVRKINPTFDAPKGSNRSDFFTRIRVGAAFGYPTGVWSGRVEYQRIEDIFWTRKLNSAVPNSDVSLAWARYASGSFDVIGGRQRIAIGNQRLIGPSAWQSLGRALDAGKVDYGQWDIWAGRLGVANTKPESARVGAMTHVDKAWGTSSVIFKHDLGTKSTVDLWTVNHLANIRIGRTSFDGEGALQYGKNNGLDQQAWAWHVAAHQDFTPQLVLTAEADAASGGTTKTVSRSFDTLYASNHNLYGLADMQGWKNMTYYSVYLTDQMKRGVTLQAREQWYFLRDPADAWYNTSGVANSAPKGTFIDPTGKSGRNVGSEFDLQGNVNLGNLGVVSGGVALITPGSFIRNVSGHADKMTFLFLQYQARF